MQAENVSGKATPVNIEVGPLSPQGRDVVDIQAETVGVATGQSVKDTRNSAIDVAVEYETEQWTSIAELYRQGVIDNDDLIGFANQGPRISPMPLESIAANEITTDLLANQHYIANDQDLDFFDRKQNELTVNLGLYNTYNSLEENFSAGVIPEVAGMLLNPFDQKSSTMADVIDTIGSTGIDVGLVEGITGYDYPERVRLLQSWLYGGETKAETEARLRLFVDAVEENSNPLNYIAMREMVSDAMSYSVGDQKFDDLALYGSIIGEVGGAAAAIGRAVKAGSPGRVAQAMGADNTASKADDVAHEALGDKVVPNSTASQRAIEDEEINLGPEYDEIRDPLIIEDAKERVGRQVRKFATVNMDDMDPSNVQVNPESGAYRVTYLIGGDRGLNGFPSIETAKKAFPQNKIVSGADGRFYAKFTVDVDYSKGFKAVDNIKGLNDTEVAFYKYITQKNALKDDYMFNELSHLVMDMKGTLDKEARTFIEKTTSFRKTSKTHNSALDRVILDAANTFNDNTKSYGVDLTKTEFDRLYKGPDKTQAWDAYSELLRFRDHLWKKSNKQLRNRLLDIGAVGIRFDGEVYVGQKVSKTDTLNRQWVYDPVKDASFRYNPGEDGQLFDVYQVTSNADGHKYYAFPKDKALETSIPDKVLNKTEGFTMDHSVNKNYIRIFDTENQRSISVAAGKNTGKAKDFQKAMDVSLKAYDEVEAGRITRLDADKIIADAWAGIRNISGVQGFKASFSDFPALFKNKEFRNVSVKRGDDKLSQFQNTVDDINKISNSIFGRRGSARLLSTDDMYDSAKLMDPDEAMLKAYKHTQARSMDRMVRKRQANQFVKLARREGLLDEKASVGKTDEQIMADPRYKGNLTKDQIKKKNRLEVMRFQYDRNYAEALGKFDVAMANKLYEIAGNNLNFLGDAAYFMIEKNPINMLRSAVFNLNLGLGNIGQLFLQGSTAFQTMAKYPVQTSRALLNMTPTIIGMVRPDMIKDIAKAQRSSTGVIEDDFIHKIATFQRLNKMDVTHTVGDTAVVNVPSLTGFFQRALNAGRLPFNKGEQFFRLVNSEVAYQNFVKKYGRKPRLDSKKDLGELSFEIDSIGFNMTSADRAWWQEGLPGLATQFSSYQMRWLGQFVNKDITPVQKASMALFTLGFTGTAGTGGSYFAEVLDRELADQGIPEDIRETFRWGLFSKAVDAVYQTFGEEPPGLSFEYFGPAAAQNLLTRAIQPILNMVGIMPVTEQSTIMEQILGPAYSNIQRIGDAGSKAIDALGSAVGFVDGKYEDWEVATAMTSIISSTRAPTQVWLMDTKGLQRTSTGKYFERERQADKWDWVGAFTGVKRTEDLSYGEIQAYKENKVIYNDLLSAARADQELYFSGAISLETFEQRMQGYREEVLEFNPNLVYDFEINLSRNIGMLYKKSSAQEAARIEMGGSR